MFQSRVKQLEKEINDLNRSITELAVLNDISQAISVENDFETIIRRIIHKSVRALQGSQGNITLALAQEENTTRTLVRTANAEGEYKPFHITDELIGWMQQRNDPLLINDVGQDSRLLTLSPDCDITSILAVPLKVKSRLIGVLAVFNKHHGEGFTFDDQRLLTIIAGQSAQVIENARLDKKERELVELQKEMETAAEIQRTILPLRPPPIPGYDIAAATLPAKMVGGDYYDFIPLPDNRFGFAIGDAAGKGMPAALFITRCATLARAELPLVSDPGKSLATMNDQLYKNNPTAMFATMLLGVLDPARDILSLANAGHNHPVLADAKSLCTDPLRYNNMVLGCMENVTFPVEEIPLGPTSALFLYTDGITEALNARDEFFGEDRMKFLLKDIDGFTAEHIVQRVCTAVRDFAGTREQVDDITMMVIKRV